MQSCSVRRVSLSSASSSSASVYRCPSDSFDYRNFISCRYMHIFPLIYAHEILSQCDMYFLNGSHFSKFLYVALLSTWLNLEPTYLAQLSIDTGATHREEIIHLPIIFLKLQILKKNHILHLFGLFGIYAKDTKLINCTHTTHTEKYRYT